MPLGIVGRELPVLRCQVGDHKMSGCRIDISFLDSITCRAPARSAHLRTPSCLTKAQKCNSSDLVVWDPISPQRRLVRSVEATSVKPVGAGTLLIWRATALSPAASRSRPDPEDGDPGCPDVITGGRQHLTDSPRWVPLTLQRYATISPSPKISSRVIFRSGKAVRYEAIRCLKALGARWQRGRSRVLDVVSSHEFVHGGHVALAATPPRRIRAMRALFALFSRHRTSISFARRQLAFFPNISTP